MFPFLYLLSLFLTGGASGLGDDDFAAREAASARLRSWGLAALPVLIEAESSPDPEARCRAARLTADALRPCPAVGRLPALWRAWRLLYEPGRPDDPVKPDAFQLAEFRDGGPGLFLDVLALAKAAGLCCPDDAADWRRKIADGEYAPWDARDHWLNLRQSAVDGTPADLP